MLIELTASSNSSVLLASDKERLANNNFDKTGKVC